MPDPVEGFADVTEYSPDFFTVVNRFTEHVHGTCGVADKWSNHQEQSQVEELELCKL